MAIEYCDVLVIGAGPAGMAAALAAAQSGACIVVIDDNPAPGGQIWRDGPHADAAGGRHAVARRHRPLPPTSGWSAARGSSPRPAPANCCWKMPGAAGAWPGKN
jgi:cation diffusion facilitator CzcD-associated flavoprotein CzcO